MLLHVLISAEGKVTCMCCMYVLQDIKEVVGWIPNLQSVLANHQPRWSFLN